jgi:hypothetical protein
MDLNWISTLGYLHPREIDFSFDKSNYVGTIKLLIEKRNIDGISRDMFL